MQIDVYQDTVCPWCRIGKRNLELALAGWDGESVAIRYHSFYLNPDIPPEGVPFRPHMIAKVGERMTLEDLFEAPRVRGEEVGLTFNFENITLAPNTTLSHQLIAIAPDALKTPIIDAIYAAYFEHGQDIGDLDVLVEIAGLLGLNKDETRQRLLAGDGLVLVASDLEAAHQLGVSSVPFFVINNLYGFSGAQPPQMIRRVLDQVSAETVDVAD